jgi:hypothetical protein
MNKLFAIHAAGAGTATTSDGRVWHYVASGLSGAPGQLVLSGAQYSLVLSDTGSAGVVWQPPTGTAVMIL